MRFGAVFFFFGTAFVFAEVRDRVVPDILELFGWLFGRLFGAARVANERNVRDLEGKPMARECAILLVEAL